MFTEYFERSLSVIPLKGKVPLLTQWQRYCDILPEAADVEKWETQFAKLNLGLCCGKASGIVGLDIDTDDLNILNACPPSPVRRRGKKGEVRAFKYNPKIESRNFHHLKIEILSTGRQFVLPPSIHPETGKPYTWVTPDTLLNFDVNDLPELDPTFITRLENSLRNAGVKITHDSGTGRNNKLKDIVTAMRSRAESEVDIVREVYQYDLDYHSPRLFTDPSETYRAKNEAEAMIAAWELVTSVTRSLIKSGVAVIGMSEVVATEENENIKPKRFEELSLPKPRGLIADVTEYCELASKGRQDVLGVGAALTLLSTLSSNRFCAGRTWPNLFVLNICQSGGGKNVSQRLLSNLLSDTGLLGATSYKSGTAIYADLPKQQERLDIIDEASMLLKSMTAGQSHQIEIVELLSHLFSVSNGRFNGVASLAHGNSHGACFNPCINLLASTTPTGFSSSVNREMAGKGLLPRFLTFYQSNLGEYKQVKEDKALFGKIHKEVSRILKIKKRIRNDSGISKRPNYIAKNVEQPIGHQYNPFDMVVNEDAQKRLDSFDRECFEEMKLGDQNFEAGFIARFAELATKVAICDAVGQNRDFISIDSVEWGISLIRATWHNSSRLYEIASSENKVQSNLIRVLTLVENSGKISHSDLIRRTQWLMSRERNEILQSLVDSNRISKMQERKTDTAKKPASVYVFQK